MAFWSGMPSDASEFDYDEKLKLLSVSRDFRTCHKELVLKFQAVLAAFKFHFPNKDLIVISTYINKEQWKRLYLRGRYGNPGEKCVEQTSPMTEFPSRGLIAIISDGGLPVFDEVQYYHLNKIAADCGLIWGGKRETLYDFMTFELPLQIE